MTEKKEKKKEKEVKYDLDAWNKFKLKHSKCYNEEYVAAGAKHYWRRNNEKEAYCRACGAVLNITKK